MPVIRFGRESTRPVVLFETKRTALLKPSTGDGFQHATAPVNDALPNSRIPSMGTHEVMLTGPDRFIEEVLAFIREEN